MAKAFGPGFLLVGAILVAGLFLLVLPRGDAGDDGNAVSAPAALGDPTSVSGLDGQSTARAGAANVPPRERTADGTIRTARVTDSGGSPLAGVRVDWRVPGELPRGWQSAWARLASEASLPLGHTETDASGLYAAVGLRHEAATAEHVYACFTLPGYRAHVIRFDAAVEPTSWVADVTLDRAPELVVRVVELDGTPVPGALVRVEGIDDPSSQSRGRDEAMGLVAQQSETDAEGSATFSAVPGDVVVHAHRGGAVAKPQRCSGSGTIEVSLHASFSVAGNLQIPSTAEELGPVRPRVMLSARHGGHWKRVGRTRIDTPDGWVVGPVPLLDGADSYELLLEGDPLVAIRRTFPPPPPGTVVKFDLEGSMGSDLWLEAIDATTTGEPEPTRIDGARARILTKRGASWLESWYGARPDGYIEARGIPDGLVVYQVFADGYAPSSLGDVNVPQQRPTLWQVELQPAGRVTGHVLLGDSEQPATDFFVYVWPTDDLEAKATYSFEGRADGAFELDSVPAGDVQIAAATLERPACAPISLVIEAGTSSEAELAVPDGLPVVGRVLDATSYEPIPHATVQAYVQSPSGPVAGWGTQRPVEEDGSFRFDGGVPGENFFNVEAEGYASSYLSEQSTEGGSVAVGDVLLSRHAALRVRVVGLEEREDLDPSELYVSLEGPTNASAPLRRGAGGGWEAGFSQVNHGKLTVQLRGYTAAGQNAAIDLAPGEVRVLELQVGGGASLSVEVVAETATARESVAYLRVAEYDADGVSRHHFVEVQGEGPTLVHGLRGEEASVRLYGSDFGECLGGGFVSLRPGATATARVAVGGRSLRVRVVDVEGNPVSGAFVLLAPTSTGLACDGGTTGADGVCEFFAFPDVPLEIGVSHGQLGRRFGVRAEPDQEEVDIVLDANGRLELRIHDGGAPIVGARVALLGGARLPLITTMSDREGAVTFERLAEGEVSIRVAGYGLWTQTHRIRVHDDVTAADLQTWRTATLELELVGEDGAPLEGMRPTLIHAGLGESVEDWHLAGRLPAGTVLETDARGRLRSIGVPRGEYRCSFEAGGEVVGRPVIEVAPSSEGPERLILRTQER